MEQLMKKYEEKVELINGGDEGEKDVMDILMETYKDTNSELKLTRRHIKKFFLVSSLILMVSLSAEFCY
jgi:hypothetical protein